MDCDSALMAYLPVEKEDIKAFDFTLAVAPVKIRVPGCFAEESLLCARRRGSVCWEKRKAPLLLNC